MAIPYRQEVLRKMVHLSSLWMPFALFYLPWQFNVIMFGTFAVLNVLIEIAVFHGVPGVTPLYKKLFGKMARESEPGKFRFSGAPPMYASACLTALCFSHRVAACAFAILILSDTSAALIGRKWGRHRFFNGKSLEGSLAFLLSGWIIAAGFCLAGGYSNAVLAVWLLGVAVSCVAEFFNEQIHLDDNFTIPLMFGAVAEFLPLLLQ
ncbi:MAG: phosphatidate cytidylyltransferase [Lentisphaeria bacterium]|nr:phosphatidate cytidylyltransferase [Lentisphaeria bacterium]